MGCFPTCFGHWRHQESKKNGPDQFSSPMDELHESVKLLPATTESLKEDEIVEAIKLVSLSKCICEEQMNSDHSNINKETNDQLTVSNIDDKFVENETGKEVEFNEGIKNKDGVSESKISSFLMNEKDRVTLISKEESSDSLFSLSIDSRKQLLTVDIEDKEVNSHNILEKKTSFKCDENKENIPSSKHPMTKNSGGCDGHQFKKTGSETAVDTSLSSWLVASEKSLKNTSVDCSPESEKNYREKGSLGAINSSEDFKELNEISSGGTTPSRGADSQVRIGTVGSYWRRKRLAKEVADAGLGSCRDVSTVCTEV